MFPVFWSFIEPLFLIVISSCGMNKRHLKKQFTQKWKMLKCLQTHKHFSSHDINWWSGVVWIIVMFLSGVWILILTAPIHCRGSIGEQVMLHFSNPSSISQMAIGWVHFHTFSFMGELFLLRFCTIPSSYSWIGINFNNNNLLKCTRTNIFQKNQCTAAVRLMSVENNRYSAQDDVMKSYCDIPSCSKSERNVWYKLQ